MKFSRLLLAIFVVFGLWETTADANQHLLTLIAVDDQTGTRLFMMYEEDVLSKKPRPPSSCARGFGTLEVIGEVPGGVSLTDDAVTRSLLTRGREAAERVCPRFSIKDDSPLRIKLIKGKRDRVQSDPVVVMVWESVLAHHGPGWIHPSNRKIVEKYSNRDSQNAKEEAMIGSGEIRPLPNNYFLFYMGTDSAPGTKFWRYSEERSKRCWVWSGGQSDVIGEVPGNVSLLDDKIARLLVMGGEQLSVITCGENSSTSTKVYLVPAGYQATSNGRYIVFDPIKVWTVVCCHGYYSGGQVRITQYENSVVEAEKRKLEQIANAEREAGRQRRWNEFIRKHGAQEMVEVDALRINPFLYQGKTVAIHTFFERMVSPDIGLFANGNIMVAGLPRDLFRARSIVVLVGRVTGTTEQVPQLKFVGVHFCKEYGCSDLLAQR